MSALFLFHGPNSPSDTHPRATLDLQRRQQNSAKHLTLRAVQSCEQFYYGSIMSRKDCQPVPVSSCLCEWFKSWATTCMSNICPTGGIASIVSEQGPSYCDATATGSAGGGASTPTAAGTTGATAGATAKPNLAQTMVLPLAVGVGAGLVGLAAVAL